MLQEGKDIIYLVYYCASRMKNDAWHITGAKNQLPDV